MVRSRAPRVSGPPGRPRNLREQKQTKLRVQIYTRALDLFRQQEYENTSINDIVHGLRISQRTFFRHFASKDDLLREYATVFYGHLIQLQASQPSDHASIAQRLSRMYAMLAHEMEADRRVWQAMALTGMIDTWRSRQAAVLKMPSKDFFEAILSKGQDSGEIGCSFSVDLLAEFLQGLSAAVISEWAGAPDAYPLAERLSGALAFFLKRAQL